MSFSLASVSIPFDSSSFSMMHESWCNRCHSSGISPCSNLVEHQGSSADREKKSARRSKHIPHRLRPPHIVERRNTRERRRVQDVNDAFYILQALLPIDVHRESEDSPNSARLSKVRTLRKAVDYIIALQEMLDEHPWRSTELFVVVVSSIPRHWSPYSSHWWYRHGDWARVHRRILWMRSVDHHLCPNKSSSYRPPVVTDHRRGCCRPSFLTREKAQHWWCNHLYLERLEALKLLSLTDAFRPTCSRDSYQCHRC